MWQVNTVGRFCTHAKTLGFWVIHGIGQFEVATRPFQLFDGIVEQIRIRCESDSDFKATLQCELVEEAGILAEVLPDLATVFSFQKNRRTLREAFGQTRGVKAISKLLSLLGDAKCPCVLILDDCQWADSASVRVVEQWSKDRQKLATGSRQLLTVISFRQEEVSDDDVVRNLVSTTELKIDLFKDPEIRQIACSMAGILPESVLQVVCRMACGSPFMATAVMRGMFETGTLSPGVEGWVVNESALLDLQSSNDAAQLLARRIDLLPAEVKDFLIHGRHSWQGVSSGLGQKTCWVVQRQSQRGNWQEPDLD